ncbi:alpha/beta hydrolase [Romboutsia sp. 13368]|uniref:alpha/beta hydrolase n=1 Tax=Romboutsia sp. 13368 TaxID=2708053 RepID=UPI0025D4235F|nr:alpha/beta fold hydrolase [Romboutsia sp. 13368]
MTLKYKNKVKALILMATPLKVHIQFNMIIIGIKIALGRIKYEDILTRYAYNSLSVERSSTKTYIKWIPRYNDLFILINKVKKQLKNISIPTLIIHTKNDELVSNKSLNLFYRKLKNDYKVITLENSGHFYYDEYELEIVLKSFGKFLDYIVN